MHERYRTEATDGEPATGAGRTASGGQVTTDDGLAAAAADVLRRNDCGTRTKASPTLYPHQWSWDSAFVAVGWARVDVGRAFDELHSLMDAQWSDGRVPHIVFDDRAPEGSYFPSADHWMCAESNPRAPSAPRTSGLIQPPVHALAAARIWDIAREADADTRIAAHASLLRLYPKLLRWHRYLTSNRDPDRSGLLTIFHPWESGTDNSPRWDAAMAAVEPGDLPDYPRADLIHANDVERPTAWEYDRYIWLVSQLREASYDDLAMHDRHPFVVKDILASAIFVAANDELLRIAEAIRAPDRELDEILGWRDRCRRGVAGQWSDDVGLASDLDLRTDAAVTTRTIGGLAPLLADRDGTRFERAAATLASQLFIDHPDLHHRLPPSTSPSEDRFHPRAYWRGPVWPVINWLLWWGLDRGGHALAGPLRAAGLDQLRAHPALNEYLEPFTDEGLGSQGQSWTAAVALDWLAV